VSVVCCVGSGLCDHLITRSEESYRVYVCVSNCVLFRNFKTRRPGPVLGCSATENIGLHTFMGTEGDAISSCDCSFE